MTPEEKSRMIILANERINNLVDQMNKEFMKSIVTSYVFGFTRPNYYLMEAPSRQVVERFVTAWFQRYPKINPYMQKWGEETKAMFFEKISQGAEDGLHPFQVARQIREAEPMPTYKANRIARTEMMRAFNAATLHRYKYSGIQTKSWSVYDPCPICATLAGEEVGINEKFSCGLYAPPLHPNCMCVIVPGREVYDNIISQLGGSA